MPNFRANREKVAERARQNYQEDDPLGDGYRDLGSEVPPEELEEVRLTDEDKAKLREKWLRMCRSDNNRHRLRGGN